MASNTSNANGVTEIQNDTPIRHGESLFTKAMRRLRKDRLTLAMAGLLALLAIFSFSAPLIEQAFNVDYLRTNPTNAFQPLGTTLYACDGRAVPQDVYEERVAEGVECTQRYHLLGTDDIGRDELTRLAYGGQLSLMIAFSAALLSLTIGVAVGVFTGFYGGFVDDIVMWFIATLNSIPFLLLLIIIYSVFEPTSSTLILVLGILGWTGTARIVRGETISLREREFVVSAKAIGASDFRIMRQHIAPNIISIVVVTLAIDIGSLLLVEAGLSFLGFGVEPPEPTWGNMLTKSQQFFNNNGWHLVIAPGVLITMTVLTLYVIGDGVRDAFDPRTND